MCTPGPPLYTDKCRRAARIGRLRYICILFFFIIIIYRFCYDVHHRDRANPAGD